MAIIVSCGCGKQFQTPDENAGRRATCPECRRPLRIPRAGPPAPEAVETVARVLDLNFDEPVAPPFSGKAVSGVLLGLLSLGCAFFAGLPAVVMGISGLREINQSRGRLRGKWLAVAAVALGAFGSTAMPLLLGRPLFHAWRETSRRSACEANLARIGDALRRYSYENGRYPPAAIMDRSGKPLLSWRVLILPYLGTEGEELYAKFHLDEPWDSPANSLLMGYMPEIFRCPTDPGLGPGLTRFQAVVGPATLFTGGRQGVAGADVTDGLWNTLAVVEAAQPVRWMAPADLAYPSPLPLLGAGGLHEGGFHALTGDGTPHFIPRSVRAADLAGAVTRAGGEVPVIP